MSITYKIKKYSKKAVHILRDEGVVAAGIKTLVKIQERQRKHSNNPRLKKRFHSLVKEADVIAADWTAKPYKRPTKRREAPYTFNWVMSPPASGGGHQNMFRFIDVLDAAGHINNIYIYSTHDDTTIAKIKSNIKSYSRAKNLKFNMYKGLMADADAVFATGWETAYPVFNEDTPAHKLYFVQDFEPLFYPMGTNYILAENTYKFGFHGITAGGWLGTMLSKDYGMTSDHYDFGADKSIYKITNEGKRKDVFFYARPVTERRGFDLGILALEIFHKRMPEYTIHLAGWDVSEWSIPFPYVNHKTLSLSELPDIYNQCAAALVISLTNMSLMPLELLASGTIPVVNDMDNNRMVSNNPYIAYAESSPAALAQKLVEVVTIKDLPKYANRAAASVPDGGWEKAGDKFLSIIERELSNG